MFADFCVFIEITEQLKHAHAQNKKEAENFSWETILRNGVNKMKLIVGFSVADSSSWTDALETLSAVSGASFLEAPLTASTFFPPTNSCPVCFKYQSTIGLKSKITAKNSGNK